MGGAEVGAHDPADKPSGQVTTRCMPFADVRERWGQQRIKYVVPLGGLLSPSQWPVSENMGVSVAAGRKGSPIRNRAAPSPKGTISLGLTYVFFLTIRFFPLYSQWASRIWRESSCG